MNADSVDERRQGIRTNVRLDVLWSTEKLTENDGPAEAVVTDLSRHGARLMCSRFLPEFTRVSLTFQDGEHTFTCQGNIAWCSRLPDRSPPSYAAGIEFHGVDNILRDRLTALVKDSAS